MPKKNQPPENDQPKAKFKIVDRRRINMESEPEPEEKPLKAEEVKVEEKPPEAKNETETPVYHAPDGEAREGMPESPDGGQRRGSDDPLAFRNIALSFLQTLSTIAWVHMGLVPHPQTQLVAKKLEEARKVISLFEITYQQVKGELPPEVNNEIVALLQDLKANYVNQL